MSCLIRLVSVFFVGVLSNGWFTHVAAEVPVLSVHHLLRRHCLLTILSSVVVSFVGPDTADGASVKGGNDPPPHQGSLENPAITDGASSSNTNATGTAEEHAASASAESGEKVLEKLPLKGEKHPSTPGHPSSKQRAQSLRSRTRSRRKRGWKRANEAGFWALFGVHQSPDEMSRQLQHSFAERLEERVRPGAEQQQQQRPEHQQQREGRADVSPVGHKDSDTGEFEGLVLAGQVIGLATDFDGSMVFTRVPRQAAQPPHTLDVRSTTESGGGSLHRKSGRPTESQRAEGEHGMKDTDATETTSAEVQSHSSTGTSSGSSSESESVDTCVTLFALARKHARNVEEYDRVMEDAVKTYSVGFASILADSRLLNIKSESCCREMGPTAPAEKELSDSRRSEKEESDAKDEATTSEDLTVRQQLLEELIAALDSYEQSMANTAATQTLLKGIDEATFEADLQEVPNSVGNFIPGALQTLVRLKSAGLPVSIISHSFSSTLITATLRSALYRAVAQSTPIEARADHPQTSSHTISTTATPSALGLTQEGAGGPQSSDIMPGPPRRPGDRPSPTGEETVRSPPRGISSPERSRGHSSVVTTAFKVSVFKWVNKVLSAVTVPGNELVFRDGVSTGVVQCRCVTLRAKRELLLKLKKKRLKHLRKKWAMQRAQTEETSSTLSRIQERLRGRPPQRKPDPERAGTGTVRAREKPLWILFVGDTLADIPALLAADIAILMGKPSAKTERVLDAAGVVREPLSVLLENFKRQAAVRKEHQQRELSKKDADLQTSKTVTPPSLDLPDASSEPKESHVSPVEKWAGGRLEEQSVRLVDSSERDSQQPCEETQDFYVLPSLGESTSSASDSARPRIIYTAPDWIEIHILLFGSAPVGPSN